MGLDATFSAIPPHLPMDSPRVLEQDTLAEKAMEFLIHLLYHRPRSMIWHNNYWPGLLALLCSGHAPDSNH
eukprot:7057501-Lingulodinium_polyedra.AAC.1